MFQKAVEQETGSMELLKYGAVFKVIEVKPKLQGRLSIRAVRNMGCLLRKHPDTSAAVP